MRVPDSFARYAARGPDVADFVDRLPRLVRDLTAEWELREDGETRHGFCAVVVPVRTASGRPAALKVGLPHREAEHEHLVLQHWHGRGAVTLLRADPRRSALLLERLHPEDLGELWDVAACEVVAGLYPRLHVPAPAQLRPVTEQVAGWTAGLAALPRSAPLPRRLVEQAVSLGRTLAEDPASTGTTIHGDLHYGNVLAADREPWLAIDPKPVSGDPHLEPVPMLWNRWEDVAGDVRGGVRRRFHSIVDAAGLDEDRARDWVVLAMMAQAMARLADGPQVRRATSTSQWLTMCVAVVKAVQD